MALSAALSSSLPLSGTYYYQEGNAAIPVVVNVYNSSVEAVQIKQVYLTQASSSLGTGASLSLGEPVFRYISSTPNTTNNIISALGTGSYNALFVPQINALDTFPTDVLKFDVSAVVQQFGYAESVRATPASFAVAPSPNRQYSLVNNFQTWSLFDNPRPPQYIGFDYLLGIQQQLKSGEYVNIPISELYYSSSNPSVASVIENTDALNSTTGSTTGVSQISSSGGSVSIVGVGNTTFAVRRYSNSSPVIASGSLRVVDALPISLTISPSSILYRVYIGMPLPAKAVYFKAYLLKSNGTNEDITSTATWTTNNISLGSVIAPGTILLTTSNTAINEFTPVDLIVKATYQGFTATSTLSVLKKQPI